MTGYTASVERKGNTVTKRVTRCLEHDVFHREIHFLTRLKDCGFVPKIIGVNYPDNELTLEYCGETLVKAALPSDYKLQIDNMLEFLEILEIQHNDIRPENVTVKDGALYLIDWQWATERNQQPSNLWPSGLGGKFRAGWPAWRFNDRESFSKILA